MSLFFYWFGVPGSRPGSLCAFTRVACYSIGHAFLTFTGDNWLSSHFFSFGVNLARSRVNCGHWLRGTPPKIRSGSATPPKCASLYFPLSLYIINMNGKSSIFVHVFKRSGSGRAAFHFLKCAVAPGVRSWFSPIEILNKMRAHFKARHFANKIN